MDDRFLYAGLIRLHVLYHAVKEPIYGLAMIEETGAARLQAERRHALPNPARLGGEGIADLERSGSAARRVYRATDTGKEALAAAKLKVRELFGELFEEG